MSQTVTPDEVRALTRPAGGKYHSRRTFVPELDRWFASAHEADQAVILWRRQQAGEIRNLRFQVHFPIQINGLHVCDYVSDFVYEEKPGNHWLYSDTVVADAKGYRTAVYRLKARLMKAVLGIDVIEL